MKLGAFTVIELIDVIVLHGLARAKTWMATYAPLSVEQHPMIQS